MVKISLDSFLKKNTSQVYKNRANNKPKVELLFFIIIINKGISINTEVTKCKHNHFKSFVQFRLIAVTSLRRWWLMNKTKYWLQAIEMVHEKIKNLLNKQCINNQFCCSSVCEAWPGLLSVMKKWFLPFRTIDDSSGVTGVEAIPVQK